ncbi:MAG: fumarylacetoacetate hydrolase family protein [Pseudomonadales bacterium]|nr:fumarylacetoacetate hydrolase family protein [Pseudomonadales bacterium]MCP5215969.1 fumarylacetoacetate hydrolase family protein [Pseudomonadales bacterium]
MKFITYSHQGKASYGVINGGAIVDLGQRLGGDLRQLISRGDMEKAMDLVASSNGDIALADVSYLPTIANPEKIICIGVNYANRNAEYRDNSDDPDYPSVFMRTPDSLTGHQQPLIRPPESPQLDYEGEIVIVIGKTGHRIAEKDALSHIAGLTIMNEGTIRDWVRHAKFNVTQGKNFVHSGSLGPWMVSADEFSSYENLWVTTRVNGEVRQHDTTANLMFPFAYLISYLSTFFVLKPGDIISTGTPNGAGARFDPPKYLAPGDVVEVEVPGIGTLSNGITDEDQS